MTETMNNPVPGIAVEWMALHASSDVELAQLSNVCHAWRNAVARSAGSSSLLLPSMIRLANQGPTESLDSFCAAWFHPDGIQTTRVSARPLEDDHDKRKAGHGDRDCCFEWRGYRNAVDILTPFGYAAAFVNSIFGDMAEEETLSLQDNVHTTTVAVRGATFARPEGYCPCWDGASESAQAQEDDHVYQYSIMVRQQQRTILQRQMLPCAILSSPQKGTSNSQKPQTTVQFLNASGVNAVRLLTPPFQCGPLVNNITIFCVGIATEDGCFMSGLKHRLELGHMYPATDRDNMIDMSCICVATDVNMGDDDDSEDDSQQEEQQNHGVGCDCPFNPSTELYNNEHDGDFKPPGILHRGQRGPGEWHLYVAVLNGIDSTIRIDGAQESMSHYARNRDNLETGRVLLDGLTIGSDHSFDMSLCFGEGGPGEGEGSIAELAVFAGTLPLPDIQALEEHLMNKHGIVSTSPGMQQYVQQEDEWKRDSRALIEQAAPYQIVIPEGVPLHVVAKDPSVSWHRTNAVTGKEIRVGRIGSRLSNGSSDW